MSHKHQFRATIRWTGNQGTGTSGYRDYSRDHTISITGKPDILASSVPLYRGDASRHNTEELLVAALSGCHMLWYLHLCADNGVIVVDYADDAWGEMQVDKDGGGRFTRVILRPQVVITLESDEETAKSLHHEAHRLCFIANSMNFPVETEPVIIRAAR